MAREEDRFSNPNWNCYEDRPGKHRLDASQFVAALAGKVARGTDDIIAQAILNATGQEWTLIDVAKRVNAVRYKGETFQIIYLDGEAILELHDVTFDSAPPASAGDNWKMTSNQNYRFLGKASVPLGVGPSTAAHSPRPGDQAD